MKTNPNERLLSLDTLRGFDMLWIVGLGTLFEALGNQTDWGWADTLATQMHHASWMNFRFFDLIFPLFMFISGAAIPYALIAKLEKGVPKKELYHKVLTRAILLVIFGAIYNGALQFEFSTLRVASVLGQIGLAYLIASFIAINFRSFKAIVFWIAGILVAYSALQWLVPVPGHGAGVFTGMGSINGYIDRMLLPGKTYNDWGDPEGLLCIVSGSTLTLMGTLAGLLLRSRRFTPYKKVAILAGIGAGLVILALILKQWYPIIKALWTPPFNMLSAGLSFLLLAAFFLLIDVWKYQKWTFFFRVIGLNSITIYMASSMINFWSSSEFLFGGLARLSGNFAPVVIAGGVLALEWMFLYFMYKKNVFLKV